MLERLRQPPYVVPRLHATTWHMEGQTGASIHCISGFPKEHACLIITEQRAVQGASLCTKLGETYCPPNESQAPTLAHVAGQRERGGFSRNVKNDHDVVVVIATGSGGGKILSGCPHEDVRS